MGEVYSIEVVPYNPQWPFLFQEEAAQIKESLGENCLALHHIGSTSIPDLIAKPKIDILAVVARPQEVITVLENIGFIYKGEHMIPFKYGFSKRGEIDINLHVYEKGHPEIDRNILFRDYLRHTPKVRDEYAKLKISLLKETKRHQKNNSLLSGYNLGKNDFICKILKEAGFNRPRFLRCVHYRDIAAVRLMRQDYFLEKGEEDVFIDSFHYPIHYHFVWENQGEVEGYAHVHWAEGKGLSLQLLIGNEQTKENMASLIERWLEKESLL